MLKRFFRDNVAKCVIFFTIALFSLVFLAGWQAAAGFFMIVLVSATLIFDADFTE